MGSEDVKARERQLNRAEAQLKARKALLEGRGLEAAAQAKDPTLRRLQADLRKAKKRIAAPHAAQAHVEKVAAKIAKGGKKKPTGKKGKGGKQAAAGGGKGGKGGKGDKGDKGDKGGGAKGSKGGKGEKKK